MSQTLRGQACPFFQMRKKPYFLYRRLKVDGDYADFLLPLIVGQLFPYGFRPALGEGREPASVIS